MKCCTVKIPHCPNFSVRRSNMDISQILDQLKSERDRLNDAIAAL